MSKRLKKPRGKLEKIRRNQYLRWMRHQDKYAKVSVSDITDTGFWLHTPKNDFYITKKEMVRLANISLSVSIIKRPPFTTVSEEDLRNVEYVLYDDVSGDSIYWPRLDLLLCGNYMDEVAERGITKPDRPPKFIEDEMDVDLRPLETDRRIYVWYVGNKRWSEIKGGWKKNMLR